MLSFHDNKKSRKRYRYAVYFTPRENTPWARAGSQWLGRCIYSGRPYEPPIIEGMTAAEFRALTQTPCRYGWHATLKAPFRLAVNQQAVTEATLIDAIRELASSMRAFTLPRLKAGVFRNFIALRVDGDQKRINAVARTCVTSLHHFAHGLNEQDFKRMRHANLSAEQDRLLLQWGYPWVLDQFQFHMSLSGSIDGLDLETRWALLNAARTHFSIQENCRVDQICLFCEPAPNEPFVLIERFDLLG
jgi:Protein of unknown function (DUF1045)